MPFIRKGTPLKSIAFLIVLILNRRSCFLIIGRKKREVVAMSVAAESRLQPPVLRQGGGGARSRIRRENTERLMMREKKLVLVLDLDNTLLHSVDADSLTPEEVSLMRSDESMSERGGVATKLRPHAREFLREASGRYEMYVFTMGCRGYALQMAGLLDPSGSYFGRSSSRVFSREDCSVPGTKGLGPVPAEERVAVVLDDSRLVWSAHPRSLLSILPYRFFGSGHGHGPPREEEEDALETKLRALECVHQLFFCPYLPGGFAESDVRKLLWMFN